jgi:drug/metabolite transporter (DMT)-like permease
MKVIEAFGKPGIQAALTAALLFGAGTPLAKALLTSISPWLMAGLLYLGAGLGLTLYRTLTHSPKVELPRHERFWFAGAILFGGTLARIFHQPQPTCRGDMSNGFFAESVGRLIEF